MPSEWQPEMKQLRTHELNQEESFFCADGRGADGGGINNFHHTILQYWDPKSLPTIIS